MDTLNIKDFGVVGDGSTNDADAIQTAIDEASKTGLPLFIPPGEYELLEGLSIKVYSNDNEPTKNLIIYGSGESSILNFKGNGSAITVEEINGSGKIRLQDFTITAEGNPNAKHGIDFVEGPSSAFNCVLDHLSIHHFSNDHSYGISLKKTYTLTAYNCMIRNCNSGVGLFHIAIDVSFYNCWIRSFKEYGVHVKCTTIHCRFDGGIIDAPKYERNEGEPGSIIGVHVEGVEAPEECGAADSHTPLPSIELQSVHLEDLRQPFKVEGGGHFWLTNCTLAAGFEVNSTIADNVTAYITNTSINTKYNSAKPDGYVIEAGLGTFWDNNRISIKPPTIKLDARTKGTKEDGYKFASYRTGDKDNVNVILSSLATVTRIERVAFTDDPRKYNIVALEGKGRMRDGEFILRFDSSNIRVRHKYDQEKSFYLHNIQKGQNYWHPEKGDALILRKVGVDGPFLEIGRYLADNQTASSSLSFHVHTVAIDPLSLILSHQVYVKLKLPRPPTIEILREQVRELVENMESEERKQAFDKAKTFRNYVNVLEQELGEGG